MADKSEILIVGLGNDFRKDDGVGLYIARRLREILSPSVTVVTGVADGTDLIELWNDRKLAVVIDAVSSGSQSGAVHRFNGLKDKLPEKIFPGYSTHAFNIARTIKMARILKRLPRKLIIYGIEGADFSAGHDISPEVKTSADNLIPEIEGLVVNSVVAE